MKTSEVYHILAAIVVLTIVIGFSEVIDKNYAFLSEALLYAVVLILVTVIFKKGMAALLESDAEHKIWSIYQTGWKKQNHFKKPVPAGLILPLVLSLVSLGGIKLMTLLSYEAVAKKTRSARSFGNYTYTAMTDWHNALIGAAGIVGALLVSLVSYFLPLESEVLFKVGAYYAFWNMIPYSDLDGSQIFFGSRVLWTALAVITLIFTSYALFLR